MVLLKSSTFEDDRSTETSNLSSSNFHKFDVSVLLSSSKVLDLSI